MANPDRQNQPDIARSEQVVLNKSFDETYDVLAVELLGENAAGNALYRLKANEDGTISASPAAMAVRLDDTSTTDVTYVGKAVPGSTAGSAVWQIQKIDESSGLVITWADGNSNFDNVWNNRASLSYS